MRLFHQLTLATAALLIACAGATTREMHTPPASAADAGIERVRQATRKFRSLDAAVAAGYAAQVKACIAHPHHGVMGFHHSNRALLDARLEVERPEILVYERMADSSYALNGVEYIVPYSVHSREAPPPEILGQQLKRADELHLWYLHVWVWTENPAGLFADWNPEVKCRQ